MKKFFLILVIVFAGLLTACNKNNSKKDKQHKLKVGIVLSMGGLGDKSFNDAAFRGITKAHDELGIEYKYVEPDVAAEDESFLREFAEAKYDLIICTSFDMKNSLRKVAKDFPNIKFALIDEVLEMPNVVSLVFKEDEGSFLVGAVAGMMTKTKQIGFVGGMDIPLIHKFQIGYEKGAKYIDSNIKVSVIYTSSPTPWNDPVAGKENTLSLAKQGADVVYHAAGATGIGVIDGAKEQGIYAIGVDSDQDGVAQGTVLTSMIKKVDVAVYEVIKSLNKGEFKAGTRAFGVAEDGVGTTDFKYTKNIIGENNLKKLEQIRKDIVNGKIKI